MNHHRLPESSVHPVDLRGGSEIRFPTQSGCRSTRARKEDNT